MRKIGLAIILSISILLIGFGIYNSFISKENKDILLMNKILKDPFLKSIDNEQYIVGKDTNNYFWYNGFLWRAIKIDKNNDVTLITENTIASQIYDTEKDIIYLDSNIDTFLNDIFYHQLSSSFQESLINTSYCLNDCSVKTNNKVTLISQKEYENTGGVNGFLNNGLIYWTRDNYDFNTAVIVDSNGEVRMNYIKQYLGIRPLIVISGNTIINAGSGTNNNPYILDKITVEPNNPISSLQVGEYIQYNNLIFRIMSKDQEKIKVIAELKDNKVTELEFEKDEKSILPRSLFLMLLDNYPLDSDDLVISYWNSNYKTVIDIPFIGELMANQEVNGENYLVIPNEKSDNNMILTSSSVVLETANNVVSIRPVLYLKNDLVIQGGMGTKSSPYTIE